MKKIFLFLILFLTVINVYSQSITEENLVFVPTEKARDMYDLVYDKTSGTYAYSVYDTVTYKSMIVSNKGNSGWYTVVSTYDLVLDSKGNYYTIATETDPTNNISKGYLLQNGKTVIDFEEISYSIVIKNDIIYFVAKNNDRYALYSYDTKTQKTDKGDDYSSITFCAYNPESYNYAEMGFELGFTDKGEPFYIAGEDDQQFLVVGSSEGKRYSYIVGGVVFKDLKNNLCYNAVITTKSGNQSSRFVQGDKEWKSFRYTSDPVVFLKDNTPVYLANDSKDSYNGQQVVIGDKAGKIHTGGIYEIKLTPDGKIAYIANDTLPGGKFQSYLVIDGKEMRKFENIYNLSFRNNGSPLYVATEGEGKTFVVDGETKYGDYYDAVNELFSTPSGEIVYVGINYGNYELNTPNKNYIIIGNKKFGPYEYLNFAGEEASGKTIRVNDKGSYAFVTGRLTDTVSYFYKYKIISDKFETQEFDFIYDYFFVNDDLYFYASKNVSETDIDYDIYKNNNPITDTYKTMTNFKFDDKNKEISFYGYKDGSYNFVKIKF